MIRRSKRLEDAPPKRTEEDESDDDTFDPSNEPADEVHKKKKRKLADNKGVATKPPARKGKGKRGSLKDVVEMPLDVLFEIFAYVEPLDLLNLSRTSKDLRSVLMSRSSISTWKSAFQNVATPGLPDCPEDLNEPQYAELLFNKCCSFCGRKLAIIHFAWQIRVKTCNTCFKNHFSLLDYHAYRLTDVKDVLPFMAINPSGRHRSSKTYVLRSDAERCLAEYKSSNSKTEWRAKKAKQLQIIENHAWHCEKWAEKNQAMLEAQKTNIIDGRKTTVLDYLRELGWGDELDLIPSGAAGPERDPAIVKFCQKEVTARGLQGLEEYLNKYMEGLKSRRIAREQKANIQAKLVTLKEIYTDYLRTLPPDVSYPKTADVFQEPRVNEIMYDRPDQAWSQEQIDELHNIFPEFLRSWPDSIKRRVVESMLKDDPSSLPSDTTNILELASTVLQCKACYQPFSAREVLRHRCSLRGAGVYELEESDLFNHISEFPWGGKWKFLNTASRDVENILKMCSFDPATTTIADVDNLDPIFECLRCDDVVKGRCTMRWYSLHQHFQCHSPPAKAILIDGKEADQIRARIHERQERHYAPFGQFMCTICRSTDTLVKLLAHVKSKHEVSKPIPGENVILSPDANPYREPFYFWPPRIQEDVEEMKRGIQ